MLILVKKQTIFLLKQKEAIITLLLLLFIVLGNYLNNVLSFRGTDISQMYQPMKLLSLSLNRIYLNADITSLIVMIYPILIAVPAGFSYAKEEQTKEEVYLITRLGKGRYLHSKLWAAFFTTAIIFMVPFMLEILMNMLSFPMDAIRDLSNLSIYDAEYAAMVHNYWGSGVYIASPILYAILMTLFFSAISGLFAMIPVAVSFIFTIKYRVLLILPTFILLNATTYLNILNKGQQSLIWYNYLLLFDDGPKNMLYPVIGGGVVTLAILTLSFWATKKEKW